MNNLLGQPISGRFSFRNKYGKIYVEVLANTLISFSRRNFFHIMESLNGLLGHNTRPMCLELSTFSKNERNHWLSEELKRRMFE